MNSHAYKINTDCGNVVFIEFIVLNTDNGDEIKLTIQRIEQAGTIFPHKNLPAKPI
jgi:hypothetical protein